MQPLKVQSTGTAVLSGIYFQVREMRISRRLVAIIMCSDDCWFFFSFNCPFYSNNTQRWGWGVGRGVLYILQRDPISSHLITLSFGMLSVARTFIYFILFPCISQSYGPGCVSLLFFNHIAPSPLVKTLQLCAKVPLRTQPATAASKTPRAPPLNCLCVRHQDWSASVPHCCLVADRLADLASCRQRLASLGGCS